MGSKKAKTGRRRVSKNTKMELEDYSNTARRKFAVALRLDKRDVCRLWMRPGSLPQPRHRRHGRADTHASGDLDAVLALALSETVARLRILPLLLPRVWRA